MVQLEELLRVLGQSQADNPDLVRAREVKAEANKVVKLADGLYSPIQESQQYEAVSKRMEEVMEREVDQLFHELVQENLERMVTQSVKACPSFLDDKVCLSCYLHSCPHNSPFLLSPFTSFSFPPFFSIPLFV